jgi:hypothetical protein
VDSIRANYRNDDGLDVLASFASEAEADAWWEAELSRAIARNNAPPAITSRPLYEIDESAEGLREVDCD